jgi:hypothetical protein
MDFNQPLSGILPMALSFKALQQKRTKKAAKRKNAKKSGTLASKTAMPPEWLAAASAPVADMYTSEGLFEIGMGTVWFSRRLDDGRYAISAFLVDTFCLGVKNAMYNISPPDKYHAEMERLLKHSSEKFVARDPAYVRKLVELAVAYASELGIEPHADYKIAKLIFGDVDASSCDATFNFGRDGNPCYVPGPGDTLSEQRRILKQLEKLSKDPLALLISSFDD